MTKPLLIIIDDPFTVDKPLTEEEKALKQDNLLLTGDTTMPEDKMNFHLIVRKLIGEIDPVGSTHIDNERFRNLDKTTILTDNLLRDIIRVSKNKDSDMFSVGRAGEYAEDYLKNLYKELHEVYGE